jgi:hypothetical protein
MLRIKSGEEVFHDLPTIAVCLAVVWIVGKLITVFFGF